MQNRQSPLPVTPRPAHDIPIYMGGSSEPALERVARLADGFLAAVNYNPLGELKSQCELLQKHLVQHGRDISNFPVVASTHMWVSDDPERDWENLIAPALAY